VPKTVPTPLAAALGLLPTVLDSARRFPIKVVQLPVLAISAALETLNAWQQEYDNLAGRGERLVAQLRGHRVHGEVEEWLSEPDEVLGVEPWPSLPEQEPVNYEAQVTDLLDRAAARSSDRRPTAAAADQPLPLPDYDQMTLGSLRGRLRSLSLVELRAIRDYESSHADRLPVLTLVDNRIAKLTTDATPAPAPAKRAAARKRPVITL
jgi:hypothetical protein